jgi:oligopeptide transport system substrate-binding protein
MSSRSKPLALTLSAVVSALALVLAACAQKERPVDVGARDGVLHLANSAEPADLDPQTISGRVESQIVYALIEGLVAYDPVDLSPVPGVAERWELSEDGRTYTFHLRADARWSNGEPVVAQDFVRSWQRMLTPALAADYAYMLFYVEGAEEYYTGTLTDFAQVGFRAPDARTVEIRLKERVAFFLELICHYAWYPVHIPTVEKFGGLERKGTAWTRVGNFVGNGPFVLEEWRPNQRITVAKSPTYWDRDTVRLNRIVYYPVENQETVERMFRTGQLHVTDSVPLSKIETYRRDHPELIHIHPYLGTMYARVNITTPHLRDARVRRALAYAIDREVLTTHVNRSGKIPAYAITPPGAGGFVPPEGFRGTIEQARALLAEAGHPGGQGLGRIEMLFPTSENGRLIAEAIQEMWRTQLGVDVQLVNQEWKVYLDSMNTLNYQIALGVWIGDYPDPYTFLDLFKSNSGNNRTGFADTEYDRLLAEALAAPDEARRMAIYTRLEEILAEQAPLLPVYFYSSVELIHPSVRGWHPTILDLHPFKHVWLEPVAE